MMHIAYRVHPSFVSGIYMLRFSDTTRNVSKLSDILSNTIKPRATAQR